ncbi:MAG: winged helix-turn-helix domain-containing protein, partial [Lachnospiraceae bacterium]|nr:winged helix-turn-helix domain-containing protein [Lachnospiraceae bacterium]
MRKYNLENRGDMPIYEFLYRSIRDDIKSGILRAGEKMPSKRMLAREYGVSLITVQNAYEQLVMEGYLDSVTRKGYYVADIVPVSVIRGDDHMAVGSGSRSETGKIEAAGSRQKPVLKDCMGCEFRSDARIDLTTGRIRYGNFPY